MAKVCGSCGSEDVFCRELCVPCYYRAYRSGQLEVKRHGRTLEERFFAFVDTSGVCWEWTGGPDHSGYGVFDDSMGGRYRAHRWSWNHLVGQVPDGLVLDHLCRNKVCVNPDHLEPVTPAENTRRGYSPAAMNARKTACPQGHPYDAVVMVDGRERRKCSICNREAGRRFRARRKNAGAA